MKTQFRRIEPLEARIAPAFAAVFELSSLNGLNGFKLSGAAANDLSGSRSAMRAMSMATALTT